MHKTFRYLAILSVTVVSMNAWAGIPVQDLGVASIGFEYNGALRGMLITKQKVMAHERIQMAYLRYAPVPYILFSAGGGITRVSVDRYNNAEFKGNYGFSPAFGIALYTPRFAHEIISITGAGEISYFNSSKSDYRYKGAMVIPSLGVKFSPWRTFDIEGGVLWNFLFGGMEGPGGTSNMSNVQTFKGYGSMTLHSPKDGAYLAVNFDASPAFGTDWSNGPAESTIGIAIGIILRQEEECKGCKEDTEKYFPSCKEMKKKQDKMAEEIE